MSSLKDTFDDDGRANQRINRLAVRNKKARAKRHGKLVPIPVTQETKVRTDEELPDAILNKFKNVDYLHLFLGRLPDRVKPIGFDSQAGPHIFKSLVDTFKRDGASNRGIVRCLYLLAKNIQNFLAEFKLPLTELNLRRFIAYREAIVYKLKAHHLPEGSIEHLLACDDLLNEDYDVSVTKTANLIELTVMSLTTGDSRTFRMLPNQVSTYIQNREVLDEIEKCRPNSDA